MKIEKKKLEVEPRGNWNTASDWFPTIEVNQETEVVTITRLYTVGHQSKASVDSTYACLLSADGNSLFVRGTTSCRNWARGKCSGDQNFCFAIFVGDSGHIYIHRAPATKGWMEASAESITARLRKLGIGANKVLQQGDFLLKPAGKKALPAESFAHEYMGSGHHTFDEPVLKSGRQVKITHNVTLKHHAVDGIQHPDLVVTPGVYIIGTTASSLAHRNARD